MLPIGPLMTEHRLIERMIKVMSVELQRISQEGTVDPVFIDTAVDFIRMYADRCHHGKEEDILFTVLAKKPMSAEHKKVMEQLIKEHAFGRENVKKLVAAKEKYVAGNKNSLNDVYTNMEALAKFYPVHIEKEDKHFFIPVMEYFTDAEKTAMLEKMWEFDRKMIHEKYRKVVEESE